jgi:hypothetical protein
LCPASIAFRREKPVVRRPREALQHSGLVEVVLVCTLVAVVVIVVLVVVRDTPSAPMNIVRALGASPSPS